MTLVVSSPKPKQRDLTSEEEADHDIEKADVIGVTWGSSGQIWTKVDGHILRPGVPTFEPVPIVSGRKVAETVRDQFAHPVVLHRMVLQPGQYYPRVARPIDQHPLEGPSNPNFSPVNGHQVYGSARYFSTLVGTLDEILDTVEPAMANYGTYGGKIRNLLILTCAEIENQMRGILEANGCVKQRYQTSDFIRLRSPMRLDEYSVAFSEMPWLGEFTPFARWVDAAPTQSLSWYDDYNAAKHDRANQQHRGHLKSCLEALAALWIVISAQYGRTSWHTSSGRDRVLICTAIPRWRFSDAYVHPYIKTGRSTEEVRLFPSG